MKAVSNARKPIEVCIIVEDARLTPIAEPIVLRISGGNEHGLGFLVDTLCEFGVRATFLWKLQVVFCDEPLGSIAGRIGEASMTCS
jgi:hypothetical protein